MIDPRGMIDVREWADFITLPLNTIGVQVYRLDHADHWVNWAFNLIQDTKLQEFNVADPRGFIDWKEWAARFNQVVPY
jgi:hypothetical protein